MNASDVMASPVKTVKPRDTIRTAIETMLGSHMSGLPVVDDAGQLVGVISEGDLVRRSELGTEKPRSRWMEFLLGPGHAAADYVQTHGRYVEDLMTPDPVVAEPDTPLEKIVEIMESKKIKRVPIVRGGTLLGIVTRADLLAALLAAEKAAAPAVAVGGDEAIRAAILDELRKSDWAPAASVKIGVTNGIVTLSGAILDERERDALRVAAENVAGVKSVVDELVWVDPDSGAYLAAPETK
ncbi:MAG TPA: CBS domain-containing protein [Beijerinckiaceae bacterium]|jgi:CBS domain-containing protein|nr:CBS domain-containing protein [Beijerinckiaceae bacterium]